MSSETNFKLKSLLQLTQYSQLTEFLKQYHNVIKEEFGQYIGINKALICLSKVFNQYENQHEMSSDLKEMESKEELFTVRKEIISVNIIFKDGSIIEDNMTTLFSSWDDANSFVKNEFKIACSNYSQDINVLSDFLECNFTDNELESCNGVDEFVDFFIQSEKKSCLELSCYFDELSDDGVDVVISSEFLDFKITPSDINCSTKD